jgi:hypothetical protein
MCVSVSTLPAVADRSRRIVQERTLINPATCFLLRRLSVRCLSEPLGDDFDSDLASPSSPNHPLSSLLKRKLAMLDEHAPRREEGWDEPLTDADIELVEGVKRFKGSRLGREVKDACVSQ